MLDILNLVFPKMTPMTESAGAVAVHPSLFFAQRCLAFPQPKENMSKMHYSRAYHVYIYLYTIRVRRI